MTYPDRFSLAVRATMLARASDRPNRFGAVCEVMEVCTGASAVHMHHRRARGMGGTRRPETNQAANGLAVCCRCHAWIESNRDRAKGNGWLVGQSDTPSSVRVLRRGRWVLLDDRGGVRPWPPKVGAWGEGLDDDAWPLGEYPEVVL